MRQSPCMKRYGQFAITFLLLTLIKSSAYEYFNVKDTNKTLHIAYSSYCSESSLKAWNCRWCNYVSHVTLVKYLTSELFGTQGMVGIEDGTVRSRVVVAFRGSYNVANDIEDGVFFLEPWNMGNTTVPDGVRLDLGFRTAYQSLRIDAMSAVIDALVRCPLCKEVLFTGHSLGASMATIGAVDFAANYAGVAPNGATSHLVTFGCPRTGNEEFAAWQSELVPNNTRVARERDPVPHVPPRINLPNGIFTHPPQEIWNRHADGVEWFKTCNATNGEDEECSDSEFNFDADEHCYYFGFHGGYC